jgi:glucosamine-6-phosphate deaminase
MELNVVADYDALSRLAADRIAETIAATPTANLVVATGETPVGTYRQLAERVRRMGIATGRLRVFQLDEYLGLDPEDRRSLFGWMERAFLTPLGIPPGNVVRLDPTAPDLVAACRAYDEAVREAGGIDLAILGLGPNGHIGFNEPPAAADAPTRIVDLTPESVASNARYWGGAEQVPRRALTAGMAPVLAARRIVLLVSGTHKREILRMTVRGPVTPEVPASYLQRAAGVTIVADEAAWPANEPGSPA